MNLRELHTFSVAHRRLAWPWVAIDPAHARFAFATGRHAIESRSLSDGEILVATAFTLPEELGLPTAAPPAASHHGAKAGVHGFALDPSGALLAVTGTAKGESVLVTLDAGGEARRSRVSELVGGDFVAHAVAFDHTGTRIWFSAESGKETALALVGARDHAVLGVLTSPPFPPPAMHELHVHPVDDAVLLLAACGQDGTFARVAGLSDGPPVAIPTALDGGGDPAGLVGFSSDSARVHLVEDFALRTHAWPGLEELSSVALPDDFASSYAGVVLGDRIYVDGVDADSGDGDRVMLFDVSALRGGLVRGPVPTGMWVGRLGRDLLVTVEAKGEPARGRVLALPQPLVLEPSS